MSMTMGQLQAELAKVDQQLKVMFAVDGAFVRPLSFYSLVPKGSHDS